MIPRKALCKVAACAIAVGLGALAAFGTTRVGVINWDCSPPSDTWFGGYQTRSLSPARYRYLTPYYADAKGPDEISYHRRTPAEYDRELQYAIDAGIDYFAYCWYGEDPHAKRVPLHSGRSASCEDHLWEITWARQFHMKSPLREKLGLCAIVLGAHVYTDEEVAHLAEAMREPCYEKVAGGRPLLYIFGDVTKGEILARIRRAARTAGVPDPFVVAMHGTRKSLPATGDRSVQARSAYAPPAPPKGGAFLRYPDMYAAIRRVNAAWIDQGFDIVPAFATGRDHWPRIEHQVPWTDNPPMRYASPATERELVECAKDFKAFMDANRAKCPLDHVLTYAWNEFEEGAYICPLWAPNGGADTSRLKAFAKVARIFKGEQGVTAVPDDPLPDLADVRKRLPEIFKGCEGSSRHQWFVTRLEAAERLAALPTRTPHMQAELDKIRASFRDALAHWANDPLNPAVKPVEIDARDFGVKGDGMIPFLAITGKPTEAEVRAKVAAIQAQGIDSFLIYARSGLELEYMGEEWLKLNEWFCDEAEKRGMKVWLYDEHNWPSGTCKGRVPNENDAWRYVEYGVYRNPDGSYRWTTALAPAGWVNVCEPAAVARFIELTHEVYAKRLDRWFKNKTILGIFTDEPGHPTRVTFPDGKPLVSFRKYSGLEDEYKAATGRELKADVEKWLTTKEGDVWSVYLGLMGQRFRTSYFDQLRAWCDAHGILLTGHMISENDLYGSARCNGNPILCLRGESLPGMDEIHTRCEPDRIEWVTYNVARQAILHRGNGGLAELYACGPANHVPATLRFVMWMCAFHGIDHYITCMDVMDEKGLVEKHGYLSCMGPIHPWYEKHARVLADEARVAASWARKKVSEREVAVRYPNRTAQQLAITGRTKAVPGPNLQGLLRTLELNQFTCRLVDEDESTDLPLVFTCRADGRYAEERTGKTDLTAADALALCRGRLPATFRVLVQDGTPATDVLVRTYTDGSAAVLNLQPFSDRMLVAERNGTQFAFDLPARGVKRFAATDWNGFSPCGARRAANVGGPPRPAACACSAANVGGPPRPAVTSLAAVDWDITLDAPNIRRVNFDPSRKGALTVAAPLKSVRLLTRDCAMSYAVTSSGRPIGLNEQPAKGDTVIRHIAEPYAFEMDGAKVESPEPCTSLRPCYDPLYRQTRPFDLAAGTHRFAIASGEADSNFFLPALFLMGDFAVFNGVLMPRPKGKVKLGPLAASGLADFTGTATWSAEVMVPNAARTRLRLSTGGRLTQVKLAGKNLGVRAWAPFEWDVPADLAGKKAKLEISISTSVQPMFGDPADGTWDMRFWNAVSGPDGPCGLLAADWLEF